MASLENMADRSLMSTKKTNTHSLSGLLYDMCPEIISVWITALVLKHSQYANKEADSVVNRHGANEINQSNSVAVY